MTNDLQAKIAQIEAIRQTIGDEAADAALAAVQQTTNAPTGSVTASGDAHIGQAIGINLGTVIYGRDPKEDERTQLVKYLDRLAAKLAMLPMRGLADDLHRGKGVTLPSVYTMLATEHRWARENSKREQVLEQLKLSHVLLATEAVAQHRQCVLLGAPGGGKSTFMRHLAWSFAQRGLDRTSDDTALYGWDDSERVLPVLLPLRTLAGALHNVPEKHWDTTVSAALQAAMAEYDYDKQDAIGLLRESLRHNKALLLFDGLDEVPVETTPNAANRITTLEAVRSFTHLYPDTLAVITCRTRAFSDDLRDCLAWQVETIAPFTMGQVRHFVPAWYCELAAKTDLNDKEADNMAAQLIAAIDGNKKLREMAGTPLLLTMMALVLYKRGELPRDRPQLYEEILRLLLGQWDAVRYTDDHKLPSLGDAIGRPNWTSDYILPLLDNLSYEAHATATSQDGKGRLERGRLFTALYDFFVDAGLTLAEAGRATPCFLDYIDQRSGLLLPDGNDSYTFAHLTLQEHGAGRHIVNSDDPAALIMEHRGDDRWREPIFLGMGVADQRDVNEVLQELLDREEQGQPKPIARWYRDLILAAELGADRDWTYLKTQKKVKVDRHQQALCEGFVTLLNDADQPLPVAERIRAGFLLGGLGDPRFPVTLDQWVAAWQRAQAGDTSGYFCKVEAGTYRIGGWEKGDAYADMSLPTFWIARYPITVAQYTAFIAAGGYDNEQWWTPNGWKWKVRGERTQPYEWGNVRYTGSNQAVIGVTWYEATAYAQWLHRQLVARLPAGMQLRLPTEAEWEVAAAYDKPGIRQRIYPWGNRPTPTPEFAIFKQSGLDAPAPVGCCPAGTAACGALDMVGQVWEATSSSYARYPARRGVVVEDFSSNSTDAAWRGGSYWSEVDITRCAARNWYHLVDDHNALGVRVGVSPRLPERMC